MSNTIFRSFVERLGGTTAETYVGTPGDMFYDPESTTIRLSNGTPGGHILVEGSIPSAYGQFSSNVTQTVANVNTEYRFTFNNTDAINGNIELGSGASNSRIIINQTGIYNIQFSAQVDKGSGGPDTASAYMWFKKNGTAVPHSTGFITLDGRIQVVQSWNVLADVTTVGDYFEIAYAASSTAFSFPAIAANGAVGYPETPSIIVTVTPVN